MVWFSGKYSITLVDLTNLSQTCLNNSIPKSSKLPEPQYVIADFQAQKVLVYYILDSEGVLVYTYPKKGLQNQKSSKFPIQNSQNSQNSQNLYENFEKSKNTDIYLLEDLFPFVDTVKALDLTKDKKYGVMGGRSKNGNAYISAFNFGDFGLKAKKDLVEVTGTFVNAIVMSKVQEDLVFASTDGPFLVLGLNLVEGKIDLLKIIDIQVHSKFFFFV